MPSARKVSPLLKQLRTELPKLLRDDLEVRGQVIAVLSEYLTTREETASILAELRQMRADFDARMDEQGRRIDEHTQALAALQRQVMGVGARWGVMSEEAFRAGVRALFADQPDVSVEQWRGRDETGRLFGEPADIELDVIIRDGGCVAVEIKSAVSEQDVMGFARKVDLYAELTAQRLPRRLIIAPYVDERARARAARLGIEVCEGVTPPRL